VVDLTLKLSQQWFNGLNYVYYPIDEGSFTDLVTTTQGKFLTVEINPLSTKAYDVTTYAFIVKLQNHIPQGGYILLTLPSDIEVTDGSPLCTY